MSNVANVRKVIHSSTSPFNIGQKEKKEQENLVDEIERLMERFHFHAVVNYKCKGLLVICRVQLPPEERQSYKENLDYLKKQVEELGRKTGRPTILEAEWDKFPDQEEELRKKIEELITKSGFNPVVNYWSGPAGVVYWVQLRPEERANYENKCLITLKQTVEDYGRENDLDVKIECKWDRSPSDASSFLDFFSNEDSRNQKILL